MPGSPWQFRDLYIDNSPIFSFDRIQTPVLIAYGTNDDIVPPFLADEAFVALRRLGKEAKYVKFVGEGHVIRDWRIADQLDLADRILSWFDAHLARTAT